MKNQTKTSAEWRPSRSEHRQYLPLENEEKLRFLLSVGCYMLFQHSYWKYVQESKGLVISYPQLVLVQTLGKPGSCLL